MKKALRHIIERYNLNVRLTPNQNIILCDIRRSWRRPVTIALAQAGLLVKTYLQFNFLCLLILIGSFKILIEGLVNNYVKLFSSFEVCNLEWFSIPLDE